MSADPHQPFREKAAAEIASRYGLQERSRRVQRMLTSRRPRPEKILRHHEDDPIKNDEVLVRDNLDDVLSAWSVMFVGGAFDDESRAAMRWAKPFVHSILDHPDVARYYEKHYPLALPVLLNANLEARLSADWNSQVEYERSRSDWADAFVRFVELDSAFNHENPFTDFLALIDEIRVRGYWLNDLKRALSDADDLQDMLDDPNGQRLLEGLQDFVEFSEALDELLRDSAKLPIHRGMFWLHFGYWYGGGGKRMRRIIRWLTAALERRPDFVGQTNEMNDLFERLTDPNRYAKETISVARVPLDRWIKHALSSSDRALFAKP